MNKRYFLANRAEGNEGRVAMHVRCNLAGKIRREKRDGRETIVLPSYAAKANTVLNGILYTKEELEGSYKGLNETPAPFGHPMIGNQFVPALHPQALARTYIFAWNENARWDGDRIALDVVIDEARAKESAEGREVLNAIDKEEPIATSTGLLCNLEAAKGEVMGKAHESIARNIVWDHVAILLNEEPAISPEEGVGIFVNSQGEKQELKVINSAFERADTELDWAVDSIARALEQRERAPMLERIKSAILEIFTSSEREPSANKEKADMSKEQLDALSAKVDTLSEAIKPETLANSIAEAVEKAVKPLTDNLTELQNAQKAKDEAELTELREKIVKANLMDEDTAKELTLNAARKLAEKAKPGKAAAMNGAFVSDGGNDKPAFTLPKVEG